MWAAAMGATSELIVDLASSSYGAGGLAVGDFNGRRSQWRRHRLSHHRHSRIQQRHLYRSPGCGLCARWGLCLGDRTVVWWPAATAKNSSSNVTDAQGVFDEQSDQPLDRLDAIAFEDGSVIAAWISPSVRSVLTLADATATTATLEEIAVSGLGSGSAWGTHSKTHERAAMFVADEGAALSRRREADAVQ